MQSEFALSEKERVLSVMADQMEQKNIEITKERNALKFCKEEVDRKRKQINVEDMNIMKERDALKKKKDLIYRQEL
jgi:hypothetical protein